MFAYAVVDTLVVSAKDDEVLLEREVVGYMLVKLLAVGRGVDDLIVVALRLECADTAVDGLALHHHAGEAPVGIVVDAAPFVGGVVAQVVEMNLG